MSAYTEIPKIKAENGELPPKVLNYLDGRYESAGGLLTADVTRYGAQGDGVTDDTAAIQTALDSGAPFVNFPTGMYRISAPLRIPANTDVFSHHATLVSDVPGLEAFITIWGSYLDATKHELAEPADAGSRTLTTKTPHNYQPGDILRLVSQRISTDPVDAGDDQLGWETVGGPGPFFAEFVRVQNVTENTVTLDNGLLFNGYRPDNSEETNPAAGESAYLIDTNGRGDNTSCRGFTLRGEADYGVRVIRTKNTKLRDIRWVREETGRFIQFNDTYYADADNCYIETRQWAESHGPEDLSHAAINQYHTAGAWKSGFTNCRSVRGTQAYDFTYAQVTPYPSVWCYVRTSSAEGCLHNPVTAHPGAYGIIIENNLFTDCQRAGISIRSNAAEVTHNVVSGSNHPDLPGVYVFEGGGKQSRVESNTVTNFDVAARLNDGENKTFRDRIDTIFRDNTFRGFRIGWLRTRTSGLPVPETPQGISLTGNRFETDHPNAVGVITCDLARGINGLVLKDNEFLMRGGSRTVAVKMTANSKNVLIDGSVLHSNTRLLEYDDDRYDADHGPDTVTLGNNEWIEGAQVGTLPACTDTFKLSSTSNDILLVSETNLAHATTAGKFRMSANANVNQANGFPIDNTMCWWEVENNTPAYKTQTVHTIPSNSNNQDIWRRRMTNNVPGSWKKLSDE